MSNYTQLLNNLDNLKLTKFKEIIPQYLDAAVTKNKSFVDLLKELTDHEIAFREERARIINLKISNFPYHKKMDDFDYMYQPSINKAQILDLLSLRFVEQKENIILLGKDRKSVV